MNRRSYRWEVGGGLQFLAIFQAEISRMKDVAHILDDAASDGRRSRWQAGFSVVRKSVEVVNSG